MWSESGNHYYANNIMNNDGANSRVFVMVEHRHTSGHQTDTNGDTQLGH